MHGGLSRAYTGTEYRGAGRAVISSAYSVLDTEAFKPPQPEDNEPRLGGLQKQRHTQPNATITMHIS